MKAESQHFKSGFPSPFAIEIRFYLGWLHAHSSTIFDPLKSGMVKEFQVNGQEVQSGPSSPGPGLAGIQAEAPQLCPHSRDAGSQSPSLDLVEPPPLNSFPTDI